MAGVKVFFPACPQLFHKFRTDRVLGLASRQVVVVNQGEFMAKSKIVLTPAVQDMIAEALIEAFRKTGLDRTAPRKREGIELVRQELIIAMNRAIGYNHRRFCDLTQPLVSALDRDDRIARMNRNDDPEPKETLGDA
jgi:hypothetical protein